jgi:uncharacterized protein YoaH (UPF0181 family)
MIKGPKGFAVGRLFLDEFSKVLYSTKAEEFTAVQNLVSQGFSLKEAIRSVIRKRRNRRLGQYLQTNQKDLSRFSSESDD